MYLGCWSSAPEGSWSAGLCCLRCRAAEATFSVNSSGMSSLAPRHSSPALHTQDMCASQGICVCVHRWHFGPQPHVHSQERASGEGSSKDPSSTMEASWYSNTLILFHSCLFLKRKSKSKLLFSLGTARDGMAWCLSGQGWQPSTVSPGAGMSSSSSELFNFCLCIGIATSATGRQVLGFWGAFRSCSVYRGVNGVSDLLFIPVSCKQ